MQNSCQLLAGPPNLGAAARPKGWAAALGAPRLRTARFGRRLRRRRRAQSKSRLAGATGQTRPAQSNCDPRMLEWRFELRRTISLRRSLAPFWGARRPRPDPRPFSFFLSARAPILLTGAGFELAWLGLGVGCGRILGAAGRGLRENGAALRRGSIGASFFCVSVLLRFCF